jgi:hypothetical protein
MRTFAFFCLTWLIISLNAQERFFTRSGYVDFFSSTPLEDIRAINEQVAAFLNTETGQLNFAALMKSFEFKKALMQEHFNENYVESDIYPRAKFSGQILQFNEIDLTAAGTYNVKVAGELSMHGVTRQIETTAEIMVDDGKILAQSTFTVNPEDYNIKIPAAVRKNIAESIEVNVRVELVPFSN